MAEDFHVVHIQGHGIG